MKTLCQRTLLLAFVLCVGQGGMAVAQQESVPDAPVMMMPPPGSPQLFGDGAPAPPFGAFAISNNRIGQGPGWEDSYFGGTVFLPWHVDPGRALFFGVLANSVTDEGEYVGNAGVGYRWYSDVSDVIYGMSGWYDFDDSHATGYSLAGVSGEILGSVLQARANGYVLTGRDSKDVARFAALEFDQNQVMVAPRALTEYAFEGADAEIGGLLPFLGQYGTYGYLGGYWLTSEGAGTATGFSARTFSSVTENVSIGTQYTYDNKFDSNFFATVSLSFPMGRPQRWFAPQTIAERLASQVVRRERVATLVAGRQTGDMMPGQVVPPDGGNGGGGGLDPGPLPADCNVVVVPNATNPSRVIFVDPNAVGSANLGTAQNPYTTLEAARLANTSTAGIDVILVKAGTTQNSLNGALSVTAPLELLSNQTFVSTAETFAIVTGNGTTVLPGSAVSPLINNSSNGVEASIVRLSGTGTRVFGFTFDGRDSDGTIRHAGIDLNPIVPDISTEISCNIFQNSPAGVRLNVKTIQFGANTPTSPNAPDPLPQQPLTTAGLVNQTLLASKITMNNFRDNNAPNPDAVVLNDEIAQAAGIEIRHSDDANIESLTISNNQFTNNTNGIRYLRAGDADINSSDPLVRGILISNNTFTGNADGIDINASNGGLEPGGGTLMLPPGLQDDDEVLEIDVFQNTFTANTQRAIDVRAQGAAIVDIRIGDPNDPLSGNTITENIGSGIEFRTLTDANELLNGGGGGAILGSISYNTIQDNQEHGIALGRLDEVDPDRAIPQGTAPLGGFVVAEGYNAGGTNNPGVTDLTVSNNTVTGNSLDGIHIFLDKDAVLSNVAGQPRETRIDFLQNSVSGNMNRGFGIVATSNNNGNPDAPGIPPTNPLPFIGDSGGGRGIILIDQQSIVGNLADGVAIRSAADGRLDVTVTDSLIQANRGDGIEVITESIADTRLHVEDTLLIDNFGRGVNVLTRGNTVFNIPTVTAGGTGTDSTSRGASNSYALIELVNNYIAANDREGVLVVNTASAVQDADADSATALDASGAVTNDATTSLLMTGNQVDANGQAGSLGGLAIRVGSTATDFNQTFNTNGPGSAVTTASFASTDGGVLANIDGNQFSGNIHRDVYIDTFVSTVDPPSPPAFIPDPKARLDIRFENNIGDSLDVSNFNGAYTNPDIIKAPGNGARVHPIFTQPLGIIPFTANRVDRPTFRVTGTAADPGQGTNTFNLIFSDFDDANYEDDGERIPEPPADPGVNPIFLLP